MSNKYSCIKFILTTEKKFVKKYLLHPSEIFPLIKINTHWVQNIHYLTLASSIILVKISDIELYQHSQSQYKYPYLKFNNFPATSMNRLLIVFSPKESASFIWYVKNHNFQSCYFLYSFSNVNRYNVICLFCESPFNREQISHICTLNSRSRTDFILWYWT